MSKDSGRKTNDNSGRKRRNKTQRVASNRGRKTKSAGRRPVASPSAVPALPEDVQPRAAGLRPTGLEIVGDVLWGSHFCQFYQSEQDLLDILVPYFRAGLEANEFCMWVTSEPLSADHAKAALSSGVPDLQQRIAAGQIEILDYKQWYVLNGRFHADRVLQGWVDKLNAALQRGFEGLRLTGNTFWLEKAQWQSFSDYEADVDNVIGKYRMLALCTYSLDRCGAFEVMDVVRNHQFALIRQGERWEMLRSTQREAMESALRKSEERFRVAAQCVSDIIWQWNIATAEVNWYGRIDELLGYGQGEFPHTIEAWEEIIHPDDRDQVLTALDKHLKEGRPYRQEYRVLRKDGTVLHWLDSGTVQRDERGQPYIMVGAICDITERRQTEERLSYLASFPLRNPSPVMEVDLDGDIQYMNPAALRLFPDLGEQGLQHRWLADWAAVAAPFREGQTEVGLRDVTIGERTYQQAFYHSAENRFVRVYGFDITDRKQAEQALQEVNKQLQAQAEELQTQAEELHAQAEELTAANEELQTQQEELQTQAEELREGEQALRRLNEELEHRVGERTADLSKASEALRRAGAYTRSLIEAALDPLVTIGCDGKITDVNAATEAVTGRTRKQLIGTDFSMYFTEPAKARAGYQQVFQEGFVRDYPLEIRHKDGHVTPVLYNATVYRDGAGNTLGVFAAARDVTEHRKAEAELARHREHLEDLVKERTGQLESLNAQLQTEIVERKDREARIARLTSLYVVLSRTNEAIVRTRDEQSLFGEVCRIVAEEGGFPLVWIGQVSDGEVAPTASSGPAQEYLEQIRVKIDGKLGRGPTGTCIRENHAVVNDDFATNPSMSPWKQAGLHHGFKASAAFPLRRAGHPVAALTLYAPQPGAFDAEQVALLESLAADVSYALDTLQQEQALRESEARLRLAQAAAGAGIWDWDLSAGKLEWSEELFRLFGLDPRKGQADFDVWRSALHPDDRRLAEQRIQAAIDNRTALASEYRIVLGSGEVRGINALGNTVYDGGGQPRRMSGICIDITDRKQAEAQVSRSQKTVAELVERAPFGIYVVDSQFRIAQMNVGSQNGAFRNVRPVIGRDFSEAMHILWPEPVAEEIIALFRHTLETGEPYYSPRFVNPRHDAETVESYEWELHRIELADGQYGVICYYFDSTKLREAEEALRQAHEDLQAQSEELATANEELQVQSEELQVTNEELREQEQALQESLEAQRRTAERLNLLSDTAASLLAAEEPQALVDGLCHRVMEFLDCQAFFNFLADGPAGRLRLKACAGIPKKGRKKIEWLDDGLAVCGCVARDGRPIIAEHIPDSGNERTALVRSHGIKAHACHPIMAGSKVLGTLSFCTKTRDTFNPDEIDLMKAVTDMVAMAVQRQQTQQALRETRDYLDNLFNYANAPIIVWDRQLKITRFNRAFEHLTGRKAEEVLGGRINILFPRDSRAESLAHIQSTTSGQTRWEVIEIPILRANGSVRTVLWNSANVLASDGKTIVATIAQGQDVTERKAMETELRRLNEQLEQKVSERTADLMRSVDQMQDEMARRVLAEGKLHTNSQMLEGFFQHTITPLAFLDPHFNFVRVNEAYAKADGRDPKYFVGKNHFDLYPHEENQAIFEQVVQTKQPYRAYAKPFTYPRDPQRVTYWNWLVTPVLSEFGSVQFLVLNLEDVTDRQKAFQELERRTRQLQHLTLELSQAEDRERRRLAEILHDDLQQILAAAKFHLGVLSNRVKTDPMAREIADQLNQMLKDAIEKSRSLSHELSPAMLYQSDLGETFQWLVQQVQAKHGLTVHVEPRGCVDLQSEALKAFLFRSAQEMLFNVVKHAKVREAKLRVRRVRGQVRLTLSDQGQGFDPQTLGKTAGFGLMSIRERIELLGGRMKIKSAKGRGSTFLIAVPDPEESVDTEPMTQHAAGSPSAAAMPASSAPRMRVLLVDDHEVMREGLAALLNEQQDMEVTGQAGNGREAVDLAYRLEPDVIIMDAAMPVMGGDEATRQIKRYLPKTRIIALSMFEEPQISDKMRKAGAEVYMLKTAPSDELLAAIRRK